jgi:hypothetical protein
MTLRNSKDTTAPKVRTEIEHQGEGKRLVTARCPHFTASTTYSVDAPWPPDADTQGAIRQIAIELHRALAPCDCAIGSAL